jgi:hypothetical protein
MQHKRKNEVVAPNGRGGVEVWQILHKKLLRMLLPVLKPFRIATESAGSFAVIVSVAAMRLWREYLGYWLLQRWPLGQH